MSKTTAASLKDWWKEGFGEGVYPIDKIFATKEWIERTRRELKFLKGALRLKPGSKILDVCCGVGRHSLPLAESGHDMTGVDISKKYLAIASNKARKGGLKASFLLKDARKLNFKGEFDLAINLFSSLGYFLDPRDDHKIMRGIHRALKPGGRLVVEIYNSARILHILKFCREHHWLTTQWTQASNGEMTVLADPQVIKAKRAFMNHFIFLYKNGTKKEMKTFNRIFLLQDLQNLLTRNGFKIDKTYGGLDGSKYDDLKSENLVLIATKR